ncbi:MAG: cytochrome c-type biogenesis CcmF C-terminal domain-containing protein, partial [Pseudomonadota bacterium]
MVHKQQWASLACGAILTFSLSLIGTFLVRSGVLTSVHTFATDPERGLFILLILLIAIGGSLALYAVRAPVLKGSGLFRPVSREGAMVLNNLLLSVATAAILVGTVYPIIVKAFGGVLSVGADYFNLMFTVLMTPMILAMALGPMLAWKRGDLAGVLARLKVAVGGAVAAALIARYLTRGADILAVLGMALAAWLFGGVLVELAERTRLFRVSPGESWRRARHLPRSAYGMSIAHAGVAIAIAGITASSAWQSEKIQYMRPGDSVAVAGYTFKFSGVETVRGPNFVARRGRFEISRNGRPVATLTPEKRFYPV